MKGETREQWQKLCQQAADEQDPERLMGLIREITRLLDEKEERISGAGAGNGRSTEPMSRHKSPAPSF